MQRVSGFFVTVMQRYLPDPWLFAIVLTFVVFLMGLGLTGSSALDMLQFWGEGLFGLLEFSMQMVLILVTGYVLARTRIVRSGLEAIARRAGGPASAIVITTVFATAASFIQWGFDRIIVLGASPFLPCYPIFCTSSPATPFFAQYMRLS